MATKNNQNNNGPVPKIPTEVEGLDLVTNGGIPKGRATLVAGSSGSAKTILALQFLVNGIREHDEGGVFVTFEETPEDIARNVNSFGWDLLAFQEQGKLALVDVSPEPGDVVVESGDYDFSGLMARVEAAVKKVNAQRVCVDSISALFSQFADAAMVRRELFRLTAGLKKMGVTALITAERVTE